MRHTLALIAAALVGFATQSAVANPCERPQDFVRAAEAGSGRAPVLKPHLVQGMAVLAVQQRAGERWLELAVDSAGTARRALEQADAHAQPRLLEEGGQVLLSCRSAPAASGQVAKALAQPLW